MKFISWNVNGIRACMGKGFMDFFNAIDADIFCLQETKMQEGQLELDLPGYYQYWNYAEKKGYSGTALFTKEEPMSVTYGLGIEEHDKEGRVITAEFADFYFITVYVPNSQDELKRLDYRMKWEDAKTACNSFKGSKPSGVTWMLPSAYQWERMLIGCGGTTTYTTSLYDGEKFSYGNFRTQLTNCGTNVQGVYDVQDYTYGYWSSTEYSGGTAIYAWYYRFSISDFRWNYKRERFYVRAAFAF